MKRIDLTQTFTNNMPVFPGDPPSSLKQITTIEKDTYTDHQIQSVMHVGTHIDAPLHMIPGGKTMDQISVDRFFGSGVIIDARGKATIDAPLLDGVNIPEGAIILVFTGFGMKYRTPAYFEGYPSMTAEFAQILVDRKVKVVGMDILGPDTDPSWPAHKVLLGNEVLIIENLTNLEKLLEVQEFKIIALPSKYQTDASPVRVIAEVL